MKAGDLIGFSGDSPLSSFINVVTYGIPFWSLSHVGILADVGELLLFESTSLTDLPCAIKKQPIKGSQAHRLSDRIATYQGKVWHYPLYRDLYDHESKRLTEFLTSTLGMPYDTIGAFRSGCGFGRIESCLRETDLHSLFCSEWCMAAYQTIGVYPTDNASKWNPNHAARTLRHSGILLAPHRQK